jgi:hypothetical protein
MNCVWRYDAIDMMPGWVTDCGYCIIEESGMEVPKICPHCNKTVYEINCISCEEKIEKILESIRDEYGEADNGYIAINEAIKKIKER